MYLFHFAFRNSLPTILRPKDRLLLDIIESKVLQSCFKLALNGTGVHQRGAVQHADNPAQCLPLGFERTDGGLGISAENPGLFIA